MQNDLWREIGCLHKRFGVEVLVYLSSEGDMQVDEGGVVLPGTHKAGYPGRGEGKNSHASVSDSSVS